MILNIKDLKKLVSKISIAVEKSKINPKSGWIEIMTLDNKLVFKVSNSDYYLTASIDIKDNNCGDSIHVTLLAETFIPLISKLDCEEIELSEVLNSLVLKTSTNSYTFPLIKELGKTKILDEIKFCSNEDFVANLNGDDLASVAEINSKGLVSAICARPVQSYIYIDNLGAITYTENIYINNFKYPYVDNNFKILLTYTQSKLLDIFSGIDNVYIEFEHLPTFNESPTRTNKVKFYTDSIMLIVIAKDMDITETFPSIRLRQNVDFNSDSHVVVDKKLLDKALSRLMIFDKVFDASILDYSKIIFKSNELELVSIKNKNIERVPYIRSTNVIEHESMIRFDDIVKQLKAVTDKELDISYGTKPAIVFNCAVKQLIPEIRLIER